MLQRKSLTGHVTVNAGANLDIAGATIKETPGHRNRPLVDWKL